MKLYRKVCICCGDVKQAHEFVQVPAKKYGLSAHCISCIAKNSALKSKRKPKVKESKTYTSSEILLSFAQVGLSLQGKRSNEQRKELKQFDVELESYTSHFQN